MSRIFFKAKHSFTRSRLATRLSLVIDTRQTDGIPYKPMENDDTFWTLDQHNDWKVGFDDDGETFYLMCRYDYQDAILKALAVYVAARFNVEIIKDETEQNHAEKNH